MSDRPIPTRTQVYHDGSVFCGFIVTATQCRAVYTHTKFLSKTTTVVLHSDGSCLYNGSAQTHTAYDLDDTVISPEWYLPSLAEGLLVATVNMNGTCDYAHNVYNTAEIRDVLQSRAVIGAATIAGIQLGEFADSITIVPTSTRVNSRRASWTQPDVSKQRLRVSTIVGYNLVNSGSVLVRSETVHLD